ncbi:C-type lectin domain family 4 member A-like [Nycticebus coucang]|uniref:C-type lectin domain family 4 member A-like n=1 Tax=Nycticebus coucang TaxID=9470 RepID=UPI00234C6A76|nr:C-type lectin domain family 4 member A-like [Nycticebus coucang]
MTCCLSPGSVDVPADGGTSLLEAPDTCEGDAGALLSPPGGLLTAPKKRTIPQKSKLGSHKLVCVSLLILFLLLKLSFFIAFIASFAKSSQLPDKKNTTKETIHTTLECVKNNLTITEKVWSCCPENWKSFSSKCYFISTESRSWSESQKNCSEMEAHLLVINTKEEQDFIIQNLNEHFAYFVGLSDPEGRRHWQWVDQTPYNESAAFWHPGEPSDHKERCVIVNFRKPYTAWGWNDAHCSNPLGSVCEMMKIYL